MRHPYLKRAALDFYSWFSSFAAVANKIKLLSEVELITVKLERSLLEKRECILLMHLNNGQVNTTVEEWSLRDNFIYRDSISKNSNDFWY
jgi:hypothetical protein